MIITQLNQSKLFCNLFENFFFSLVTPKFITLIGRPWAAEPRLEPTEQEKAQTLVLLHEPIVMLQAKFGRLDGAARVRLTHERIQRLDPADLIPPITVLKGSRQGQETREFMVNGKRILVLVEGDDGAVQLARDVDVRAVLWIDESHRSVSVHFVPCQDGGIFRVVLLVVPFHRRRQHEDRLPVNHLMIRAGLASDRFPWQYEGAIEDHLTDVVCERAICPTPTPEENP